MKLDTGLNEPLVVGLTNWLTVQALQALQGPQATTGGGQPMPAELASEPPSMRVVFVTLADNQGHYSTACSMGMTLADAGQKALQKAQLQFNAAHTRNSNHPKRSIKRVKVDIMADVYPIDETRVKQGKPIISDRSLVGVILEKYDQAWLPEESMREGFVDVKGQLERGKIARVLAGADEQSSGSLNPRIRHPHSNKVWIFSTISRLAQLTLVSNSSKPQMQLTNHPLLRNHVVSPQIAAPQAALKVAKEGADYLARHTTASGRMNYLYDAANDRTLEGYNILRHAGSLWSMLQVYQVQPNTALQQACHRALDYLLSTVQPFSPDYPSLHVVAYDNEAKLGGNGLALVAMAAAYKHLGRTDVLPTMQKLAAWIVATQAPDGEFTLHKATLNPVRKAPFLSGYYPGEAILGLMELYSIEHNPRWLQAADRAAHWLMNVRDADKAVDDLDRDHWLLYGLNELHAVLPKPVYVAHTRRILNAIQHGQHSGKNLPAGSAPDWLGGFQNPLNITATACMCEGMISAYRLLNRSGQGTDTELAELKQQIEAGLNLQLQFRFGGEQALNSTYLKNPERAKGGFQCGTAHWNIQIDFTQHSLTGFLMYARHLAY